MPENPTKTRATQGNILAIYQQKDNNFVWKEQHLYGSSRLGMWQPEKVLSGVVLPMLGVCGDGQGVRLYELTNHLGNVLATINDKGKVVSAQDYYPFGLSLAGRQFNTEGYRFGFNGQEKGLQNNHTDFSLRSNDMSLGRWTSVDPYKQHASPYVSMGNNPIANIDPDGGKDVYYDNTGNSTGTKNNNWFHNLLFGTRRFWGGVQVSKERFWELSGMMSTRQSVDANEPTIRPYETRFYDKWNDVIELQAKINPFGALTNRLATNVANDASVAVQDFNPLPQNTAKIGGIMW